MSEFFPTTNRGKLKIYLGYAAGTGKTYQMLEEAQILKASGVDVVIGYFEPHGRKETIAKTEGLEVVPRKIIEYRGATFQDMDTEAVIARKPQVCLVDEYAHTNVPGSARAKRWQDVDAIQAAGIDVLSTVNVQHLESLNDQIWQVTGIRVRETVPDWAVQEADELIMIDVTPGALLNRLERGVVYSPEKAKNALNNFFTEQNLTALRELALRQAAYQAEERGTELSESESTPSQRVVEESHEKLLIHLTEHPSTAGLIRRCKRVADYLHASCLAVYVTGDPELYASSPQRQGAVEKHLNFARNLHIDTRILEEKNVPAALTEFARAQGVTQIFVSRTSRNVADIVQNAKEMEITVVAEKRR